MGQSSEELKLRLTNLTKILKIGLVTIIILVLIVIGGLSVILVNTSAEDKDVNARIFQNAQTQTLVLNGSKECNLLIDGKLSKSLMLTDTDKMSTIFVLGPSLCQARVLAVGGGGSSSYGGGGSGEVLYHTIQLNPGTVIIAKVGEPQATISVNKIKTKSELLFGKYFPQNSVMNINI